MPYLDRDGVKIYYEVHGDGPTLILTHGYSYTSAMWAGQVDALSKSFQLIVWDMRGHGQSDYPSDQSAYSEEHTIQDMAGILDQVNGKGSEAIVGGLSLGGYMSMAFYRMYPKRVRALLIIDTGPGFKKDSAREGWNQTARATAQNFEIKGLSVLQNLSAERASVTHRDAKGLALAARGMLAQRNSNVIDSLPKIQVPSLIVVGADDTPFLAASEYMTKKIQGARKVVIPQAGHAVNIDQPERFLEAVMPFLNEVGSTRQGKARL
jgi:pimeloyl-ACP methyl ester carboxylesterase